MANSMSAGMSRVGSVDSLRCFAMTAVVAQHCKLLPFGWIGVWLFFVISGYVVTLSVIRRPSVPAWAGLGAFFRRRFLRIMPVYYAYIALGVAFMLTTGASVNRSALASLMGLYNNLAMIFGQGEFADWSVGHLWTISVEVQFYLLYGFALFFLSRRFVIMLLLAMLIVAPIARLAMSVDLQFNGWDSLHAAYAIYAGSFVHSDSFALGALLAFANQRELSGRIARPLAAIGAVAFVMYAASYVYINHIFLGRTGIDMFRDVISGILFGQYREVVLYSALALSSAGLVMLTVTEDNLVSWLLQYRILRRIGEISYGAYVFHAAVITGSTFVLKHFFDEFSNGDLPVGFRILHFLVAYVITIAFAELSYRYYEKRFTSVGRSLERRSAVASQSIPGG